MWQGLKVSFVIVGTTIGAGYASGREIWEFFTSYGTGSSYFLLFSILLFSYGCYIIMTISFELKATHYVYVLEELTGKSIAKIYDLLIIFYLLSTTVVMFAGSGATLEYWHIPYWLGVGLLALFVFLVFLHDVAVLINLNSILIPLLIMTLFFVCWQFLKQVAIDTGLGSEGMLPSALAFTALNMMPMIAVLSVLGAALNKREMKVASVCTALILGTLSILYNQSLLSLGDDVLLYEIPLFAMLQFFPSKFMFVVSLMLWLAIFTTALSNCFGIVSRLKESLALSTATIAGVVILCIIPLTKFGFAHLIRVLYPLYGVLNLFILATILFYPLTKLRVGGD